MRIYLSSEQAVSPPAMEILKAIKASSGIKEHLEFAPVTDSLPPKATVMTFGSGYKRQADERIVAAPSIPQLLTKPDIVTRLQTAFKLLVDPPVLPPFEYTVIWDRQDVLDFLAGIEGREAAFDIETSGDVSVDRVDPLRVISASFCAGGRNFVIPEEHCTDRTVYEELCRFLERNDIDTVNGKFDLSYYPDAAATHHFDVQLAHYALYPAAGEHGLKPTAKRYFGLDDWDEPGKVYTRAATYKEAGEGEDGSWWDARKYSAGSGYERIPRTLLYKYNAMDVYATWLLKELMKSYLADDPDSQKVFDLLMRLSDMFMGVEQRGITLDIPYLEELSKELHVEKAAALVELSEIAGKPINPNSPKQVKTWFQENGHPRIKGTAEKIVQKIVEDTPDTLAGIFAAQLLVCRGYSKTLGTYVDGYKDQAHDGQVYPGYKLIASTTGRLGGQGASMLTIPREKRLKKMVKVSTPGNVIVGADLSQAELRVMAVESDDQWLIDAFQPDSPDFFDLLLGQAYPKVDWVGLHARVGAKEATGAESDYYNDKRAKMKGVVYGVSFGRGTFAIATALKISINEAQTLVDAFIRPGSSFDMWRTDISERAVNGESIVTRYGRHFQSELVTEKNEHSVVNSALSFTSQSTGNDICLSAALTLDPQLAQYGYWLLGTIHDAIICEGPKENVEVVGELLVKELAKAGHDVYGDTVLFTADWGYGADLSQY